MATVHPEDRAGAVEETRKALTSGTGIDFSYRALRTDGTVLMIETRGEIVLDEHGAPASMIGTLLDITDRHAAAEALRESEERARSVIATAGDAYIQYDRNGVVAEWNHQAEKTFGWSREEAVGQHLWRLIFPRRERSAYERALSDQTGPDALRLAGERLEARAVHRSGREFPVEVTIWPIVGHQPLMAGSFIRDISERLAAERAKDEFLSVVGHELRTPLTSIHGAFGLLHAGLLGELNDRGRHIVEIAAHSTERLVRLINDILDIERLSSGEVPLERQECDIAALGDRSLEAMRQMAEAAGVCLEIDAQPAVAWADPDCVEQVLTNLLSNAIKFSPAGATVSLAIRTAGSEVAVEVRDQGRGIPLELLEVVFDRFQQVDGSDAREKGGTGLGLAICRMIVEQHGGRIWAEDTRSCQGATLAFTLPGISSQEQPSDTSCPKILVHGGDASADRAVAAMVRGHGYEPVGVPPGTALVDAASDQRPAVILLDMHTQGRGGWQAASALRGRTETRGIPVLVLDLHSRDAEGGFPAAVSAGDAGEEPFDADALVACLAKATESTAVGSKLLLVEDDQSLAEVLTKRLTEVGIDVHHAPSAQRATAICDQLVPDLLALNLRLPDLDRHAVLAQLRRDPRLRGKPLTMYTAGDLSEVDRHRMRQGEIGPFATAQLTTGEFERRVIGLLDQLTQLTDAEREPTHV